jgi:type IV secretion system protein VirD4
VPKEEQSLASCLAMVRAGEDFDWMDDIFMPLPFEHMARKSYETFRLAVDKTRAGVLVGLATRLNVFDTPEISAITGSSSIDFDEMGKKKMATFVITPDSHSAFNFIPTMFFGQVLQRLYFMADQNGGRLDVPVFFLLDEFANTGQIPDFNQKLSTSRSRNINISIVLQSIDQLMDLYKDIYENIMANCDTHLFLGSQAIKTCEYISKSLGEATINKKQASISTPMGGFFEFAGNKSQSISDQSMGRALMTIDELKRLSLDTSIVMVKGMRPIKAKKYDVSMHPMDKEREKFKLSHNDPSLNHRKEWRILNPYQLGKSKPAQNVAGAGEDIDVEDIDIQKQLEAKFDELFGSLND